MILGSAAAQPHQARGQDGADLTQVRREVDVGGVERGACHPLPLLTEPAIRITLETQIGFDFHPLWLIERRVNCSQAVT